MRYVLITLMADVDSKSFEFCSELMKCLTITHKDFSPQFIGYSEPIRKPIFTDFEDNVDYFRRDNVIWKRKKPDCQGEIYHYLPNRKAASIVLSIKYSKVPFVENLFRDLIDVCDAKYGYIHLCTEREQLADGEDAQILGEFFSMAADIPIKQKGFNSLGWRNYFSKQYAARIDLDGLAKAGFSIEIVDEGFYIQVSEKITDVIDDLECFLAKRKIAKSYFDESFFRKPIPIY